MRVDYNYYTPAYIIVLIFVCVGFLLMITKTSNNMTFSIGKCKVPARAEQEVIST